MSDQQLPAERRLPGGWQPAPAAVEPGPANVSMSLRHIFAMLRRHFRLVVLASIAGLALGVYMASREVSTYRAVATVRLAGERRALTNEDPGAPIAKSVDPMVSLAGLIGSRSVLRAVVDSLGLQLSPATPGIDYSLFKDVAVPEGGIADTIVLKFTPDAVEGRLGPRHATAAYGQPLDLGLVRFTVTGASSVGEAMLAVQPKEVVVDWLAGELTIVPREASDIISISFVSPDPRIAQQVVNTAVRSFHALNIRSAQELSRRRREVLAEQLAQTDSQLETAQARLAAFRSRQQLASSQNQLSQEQNAMAARESMAEQLQTDRRTIGALLETMERGSDTDRRSALQALATSTPAAASQYQQLSTLLMQRDSMTTGPWAAAPTNPNLVRLQARIKDVENDIVRTAKGQMTVLDQKIRVLNATRATASAGLQNLPAMVEEELQLNRTVQLLSSTYDQLQQEYQRARMAEAVQAGDVDIVDLAALPYVPLWGTGPIKVAVGLLLGLLLGCGGAFLLEAMNKSIRRPEEIEGTLQIPGLAVIPPLSPSGNHHHRPGIAGLLRGTKRAPVTDRSKVGPTGTTSQPFSVGTEAFRMLRTSLIWSEPGAELKTLVVTSAAPGEGKTLTAANLAATFAYEGLRVLLIDCDIRRPRLHGLFRVPRAPGLMELLNSIDSGDERVAAALIDGVIRSTPVKGLSLLACGSLPTDPSTLLSGSRMRTLLHELGRTFDLVVLDTPPVLATADAGILGALADGVLLVVRAGQTDREAARRAQQQLAHVGARVVGAVLNDPGGEVALEGDYYYPYDYAAE